MNIVDLAGLNPEQRQAAETINGPVLILAGAGSGKTRTITYRIGHMIANLRIPPKDILAVSFTNKAALEMNERVTKLIGRKRKRGISLSTFHSLGIKILREDIHHIGYSKDFTIYDQGDQMAIIREGLKQFKMDKASFDKKTIASKIGLLKNNGISHLEFKDTEFYDPENPYDVATEYVYHFYQDKLHFYNAVDFDDILFLCVKLFEEQPEVAKKYSARYKYIMIDEYQDTNGLQFEMVRALTSTHHNICVVGDDDQSIYAFRGADITNILNFEKLYQGTKVIKLEYNYRSQGKILKLANSVIKDNKVRKDKTMKTKNFEGPVPILWSCGNSDHEAQIVVDEIIEIQKQGKFLGDVALLYRSNTQIPPFEDQLRLAQVPYTVIGGQKFYEKKEIKDLIAYLSVIHNPKDELSLRRILNIPQRGIGTQSLKRFLDLGKESNQTLLQVIRKLAQDPNEKKAKPLSEFIDIIDKGKLHFENMTLTQALNALIEEIGYFEFIKKSYDSPKVAARKKDDVRSFLLSTDRFVDRFHEEATLGNYLERLLLVDNQDNQNNEEGIQKNEVQLMTLHSSKGLEFDTCFMVGVEEELLPHKNVIKESGNVDEERRLCYVGMTRAKRRLIMTFAKQRKIYGKDLVRHPSRFLIEHDQFYVEQDRNTFGHLSEEEAEAYKSNFFNDLLKSLDD
ncbi:MAG: ATP-dependent DNA helicase Rep [Halobacteriovoraceae bacterium]|nr:ATP-dependent DNA helicase Rep [Halobacteriovoraceae bacterium]|tara:strand:+ start:9587 stop:11629 length:2043 start_codon:yes stop_codon:yes gene_type:complete